METITTAQNPQDKINVVDALWTLIQSQTKAVRKELTQRLLAEQESTKAQQKMVRESLTRAFNQLHAGKVNHDARNLFAE